MEVAAVEKMDTSSKMYVLNQQTASLEKELARAQDRMQSEAEVAVAHLQAALQHQQSELETRAAETLAVALSQLANDLESRFQQERHEQASEAMEAQAKALHAQKEVLEATSAQNIAEALEKQGVDLLAKKQEELDAQAKALKAASDTEVGQSLERLRAELEEQYVKDKQELILSQQLQASAAPEHVPNPAFAHERLESPQSSAENLSLQAGPESQILKSKAADQLQANEQQAQLEARTVQDLEQKIRELEIMDTALRQQAADDLQAALAKQALNAAEQLREALDRQHASLSQSWDLQLQKEVESLQAVHTQELKTLQQAVDAPNKAIVQGRDGQEIDAKDAESLQKALSGQEEDQKLQAQNPTAPMSIHDSQMPRAGVRNLEVGHSASAQAEPQVMNS